MISSRIRRWLRGDARDACGLHDVESFGEALRRERTRVDRSQGSFALLSFGPRHETSPSSVLQPVIDVLARRRRLCDEVGWINERELGVLLPGTDAKGAWTVADDVRRHLDPGCEPPVCQVFTYPSITSTEPLDLPEPQLAPPLEGIPQPVIAMETLFMKSTPIWKRALDIVGASTGLVVLSPILLAAALAVKWTSSGPIFFRQQRSGKGSKPFWMIKFRSMVIDAESQKESLRELNEQDGPAFKIEHDPRVTWIGRWLRKTSIDELPQLWNVLRGEMSLVGPRPLPCDETAACDGWARRRLDVLPGITCIWQVRGRSTVSFDRWVRMDVQYIAGQSFWSDVSLICQTVPAVLARRGAS